MADSKTSRTRAEKQFSSGSKGRRGFIAKSAAVFFATAAYAVPALGALAALLTPMRKKGSSGQFLRLASLETLPADGVPRKFPVVTERVDAWTRSVEPVGAVYLRRTSENSVEALHVACPHAGCTVEHKQNLEGSGDGQAADGFICPCHKATFDLNGRRLEKDSQSPRDLDTLPVEIRNGTEVWVQFQNFQLGTAEKAPIA